MRKAGKNGFTLLEVMVATVIVGVSFGVICSLLAQTARTASVTERTAKAALLAQSQLDFLAAEGTLQSGEGAFPNSPGYRWKATLTPLETSGLNKIVMQVQFRAPGGNRSVEITSLLADRTVQKSQQIK
jgi:prepilin-type N-terminal cleavage/methylation domain-containing protein